MARCYPILLAVLCIVFPLSCKEPIVERGKCVSSESLVGCKDPSTALRCVDLRLQALPCRGANGCKTAGERAASCDESIGHEGDRCQPASEVESEAYVVCTEDKQATLTCKDGALTRGMACRGPKGCVPGQLAAFPFACDRTIAKLGEPCKETFRFDYAGACSDDGKALLGCDKDERGKFALKLTCGGPKGCAVVAGEAACDRSAAVLGAPCGKDDENSQTCGEAGALVLSCRDGTWQKEHACGPKLTCVYRRHPTFPKDLCQPAPG